MMPERILVAGLPVSRAGVGQALDVLWSDAENASARTYVLVNGFSSTLRRQSAYSEALHAVGTVPLVDGASVAVGAILSGQGRIKRCPGPDLMEAACARAASDGTSFYLLGGAKGVAQLLASKMVARHPGLRIAGAATPPFGDWSDDVSARMADEAAASGARIIWLGVSAPKQEVWATRWASRIGRPVVCVGAAFDFLSGTKPRSPRWMRAVGIEWVFRLVSEPRRVWRRYLLGNGVFLWDLVRWGRRPAR